MSFFSKVLAKINNGLSANDGTGDDLRTGSTAINGNWDTIVSVINALASSQGSGIKPYSTLADLNADTSQPDGIVAVVYGDTTPANNTSYVRRGGAWVVAYDRLSYALGNGSGFMQRGVGAILRAFLAKAQESVSVLDYGADPSGSSDSSAAIVKAIAAATSTSNVNNGKGMRILFPCGTYLVNSTILVQKSNITFVGEDMRGTNIVTTRTDGSPIFKCDSGTGVTLTSVNFKDMTIAGNDQLCVGLSMKAVAICRLSNVLIEHFTGNGLYLEQAWDCVFTDCVFRNNGSLTNGTHAAYIYNGVSDNSNRLIFAHCHFEANYGSHVRFNSSGNSRRNSQNQFLGCKFHGVDPSALPGANPATPALYLDADQSYVTNCYFYQTNDNFVFINGSYNSVINCKLFNCTKSFFSITGSYNKIDCLGVSNGSGIAPVTIISGDQNYIALSGNTWGSSQLSDTGTNTVFIRQTTTGYNLTAVGLVVTPTGGNTRYVTLSGTNASMGSDGGRLTLWNNMYRSGSSYIQTDGTNASYGLRVSQLAAEGITLVGAAAGGTNGGAVTPSTILTFSLSAFTTAVPVVFNQAQASSSVANKSLFVDSADNKLKYKDAGGVVNLLY